LWLDVYKIGIENLVLPQGTNLIINVHQLHRKKEIWGENADKFEPENFLPERVNQRHNYCFLPFANGTRLCIGENLFCLSLLLSITSSIKQNENYSREPIRYEFYEIDGRSLCEEFPFFNVTEVRGHQCESRNHIELDWQTFSQNNGEREK
jgi:Cytochrome P450